MLDFFIHYCNGHFIIPVFPESPVIRIEFAFWPKERLYTLDLSNKNRFFVLTSVPFI